MTSDNSPTTALLPWQQMQDITHSFRGESRIISCYLDGREKVSQWREFIADNISRLQRQGQPVADKSIELLFSLVAQNQVIEIDDQVKSLAIFISADEKNPQHHLIGINKSIYNHFATYRKPDLLPLINAGDPFDSSVLLALVDGSVRVYDIDNGIFKSVGWARAPHVHAGSHLEEIPRNEQAAVSRRLKLVCMELLKRRYKPMIVAAQLNEIGALKNWLPRQLSWTVQNEIEIPAHSNWPDTIEHIKQAVKEQSKTEALRQADQVVNSLRVKGSVAIGPVSTLRALSENRLHKLIIDTQPTLAGNSCPACGDFVIGQAAKCPGCGNLQLEHWDPYIEATYLAIAKGVQVVPVESESLRYFGGIGGQLQSSHAPTNRLAA